MVIPTFGELDDGPTTAVITMWLSAVTQAFDVGSYVNNIFSAGMTAVYY